MNRKKLGWGALAVGAFAAIAFLVAIAHAGGWDNFKLRYASLTQILHESDREFDDLEARAVSFEDSSRIDLSQLLNGGPPKDGIPSIDNPQFDSASTTPFGDDELVIGVVINGEARAYPFGILNWHEIVNDTVGGVNVSVTYCPLCDTMLVVERGDSTFGVSGKLYQSCLVMYDRADDTLYAQPWGLGIVGGNVNANLDRLPAVKTTLGNWLALYPDSDILSTDTGYSRDYSRYPYGTYYTDNRTIFPVRSQDLLEREPKDIVTYIWSPDGETPHNQFSGDTFAFGHDRLQQEGEVSVEFDGDTAIARWNDALETVVVETAEGEPIPSTTAFAFVYPAYFERAIDRDSR